MKRILYICALTTTACLSLSTAYSSDYLSDYTPRTSRVGLLKTTIVGLGLMSMPETVRAMFPPKVPTSAPTARPTISPIPFRGFGDCYVGTVDPDKTKDMSSITINTIKTTPCNFYFDYHSRAFTPISMVMSTTCVPDFNGEARANPQGYVPPANTGGYPNSPRNHCEVININQISMCNQLFPVNYTGEIKWNYRSNGLYKEFSLYLYNSPSLSYNISQKFDNTFNDFMKTGNCLTDNTSVS